MELRILYDNEAKEGFKSGWGFSKNFPSSKAYSKDTWLLAPFHRTYMVFARRGV